MINVEVVRWAKKSQLQLSMRGASKMEWLHGMLAWGDLYNPCEDVKHIGLAQIEIVKHMQIFEVLFLGFGHCQLQWLFSVKLEVGLCCLKAYNKHYEVQNIVHYAEKSDCGDEEGWDEV